MASAVSKRRNEAEQALRHQQQRLVRRIRYLSGFLHIHSAFCFALEQPQIGQGKMHSWPLLCDSLANEEMCKSLAAYVNDLPNRLEVACICMAFHLEFFSRCAEKLTTGQSTRHFET